MFPSVCFFLEEWTRGAIVALMSRVSSERPKTFSVVFSEQQFSEASHSRLVAEKFKTDHCEVELGKPRYLIRCLKPSLRSTNRAWTALTPM